MESSSVEETEAEEVFEEADENLVSGSSVSSALPNHSCKAEPMGYIFMGGYRYMLYACLDCLEKNVLRSVRYSGNGGISAEITNFPWFVSRYCNGGDGTSMMIHVFDMHKPAFRKAVKKLNWSVPENCVIEYTRKIGFVMLANIRCAIYACPCTGNSTACIAYLGHGLPVKLGNHEFMEFAYHHLNPENNGRAGASFEIPLQIQRDQKNLFEKALQTFPPVREFKVEFTKA